MTWLSRISFSLAAAAALHAADVTGRVQLEHSRQASVNRRRDYSGVVVWLAGAVPARTAAPRAARMVQKDKTFTPHVLAIEVGAAVDFPNYDPIFHNAFSNYDGQVFDVGLYPPGTSRRVVFDRPGIVRVFCNIHSTMSAVIVVSPGPWFAATNAAGAFSIPGVPPGNYILHVFHERATPQTLRALERRVQVGATALDLGPLLVSESGYLPVPHQNKYGREYPEEPDENQLYPAVRK